MCTFMQIYYKNIFVSKQNLFYWNAILGGIPWDPTDRIQKQLKHRVG